MMVEEDKGLSFKRTDAPASPRAPAAPDTLPFNERECLAFDPFQNPKGDSDERILTDRIVTARQPGPCAICGEIIQPGERVRRQVAVVDGDLHSCRCCQACCIAMAASWKDNGEAIEARYHIGFIKVHPWAAGNDAMSSAQRTAGTDQSRRLKDTQDES